ASNDKLGQTLQELVRMTDAYDNYVESLAETDADERSNAGQNEDPDQDQDTDKIRIGEPQFEELGRHNYLIMPEDEELSLEEIVENGDVELGLRFNLDGSERGYLGSIEIISRDDVRSLQARRYFLSKTEKLNEYLLGLRLKQFNLPASPAIEFTENRLESNDQSGQLPIASIIPLVLVLMTITGAVYPAIDLTAGERERGTLETLMAAPIPRFGILFSKFIAVLTVAILTAMLNLIGMFATIWTFQLDNFLGEGSITLLTFFQVFFLLILFAAFFSALLLAVTSFAKSFKEAQVYLIPIILLSLGPGLVAMSPGMKLNGFNTVIPMVNVILLARDMIEGNVEWVPAVMAILSTGLYAYLILVLAARIFGSDSILYAGSGSFVEMLYRPATEKAYVPLGASIFGLLMLFPINFIANGFVGRMSGETTQDLQVRFMAMALFTFLAFMLFPWLIAKHQKANIKQAFGLSGTRPVFLVAGLLLGISLWPIVMFLVSQWHDLYGFIFGAVEQDAWKDRLVETTQSQVDRIRQVQWPIIAICLSIIPAICEEWFFRGMLLRSLTRKGDVVQGIVLSALLFGLFHILSNSVIAMDRLIPTTLIGLMLGYLAWKSNSILPGIILHAINNAFVVFLAYFQPRLEDQSWFPAKDESIPLSWVVAGLIVAVFATGLVAWARKNEPSGDILERRPNKLESVGSC
ncbi:MAG: CPBP family glutamic-type intramembrane protease, partial [Planctomycetota bacterium]